MGEDDRGPTVADCLLSLRRAGWCVGDASVVTPDGVLVWLVTGHQEGRGGDRLRAEGPTALAAWRASLAQAKAIGLGGGLG